MCVNNFFYMNVEEQACFEASKIPVDNVNGLDAELFVGDDAAVPTLRRDSVGLIQTHQSAVSDVKEARM